jgi:glycosyltransferase involved in cell wall biosynthesis
MTISLVIPVYNEENDIGPCLDAVMAQTVKPLEVIVVDNNSTDKSMEVVKKYPSVKIITETKQGVDFARDTGFNAAKGDVIGRIDADTQLPIDWIENLERIFKDQTVAAVTGPAYYKDMPAPNISKVFDTIAREMAHKYSDFPFLFGTNMAIRRSAWQAVKDGVCHIKTQHEDIDLGIHVAKAGLKVIFDRNLVVGMSMRRINDSPSKFYKYLHMTIETYDHHGVDIRLLGYPYTIALLAIYPGMRLVKRAYDPASKQFSLKKFINNEESARKNPMA